MWGEGPRKKCPHSVTWYTNIATINGQVGPAQLPQEGHEAFRVKKTGDKAKEQKGKKEKKEDKKADDDDLFGDDD